MYMFCLYPASHYCPAEAVILLFVVIYYVPFLPLPYCICILLNGHGCSDTTDIPGEFIYIYV